MCEEIVALVYVRRGAMPTEVLGQTENDVEKKRKIYYIAAADCWCIERERERQRVRERG